MTHKYETKFGAIYYAALLILLQFFTTYYTCLQFTKRHQDIQDNGKIPCDSHFPSEFRVRRLFPETIAMWKFRISLFLQCWMQQKTCLWKQGWVMRQEENIGKFSREVNSTTTEKWWEKKNVGEMVRFVNIFSRLPREVDSSLHWMPPYLSKNEKHKIGRVCGAFQKHAYVCGIHPPRHPIIQLFSRIF